MTLLWSRYTVDDFLLEFELKRKMKVLGNSSIKLCTAFLFYIWTAELPYFVLFCFFIHEAV